MNLIKERQKKKVDLRKKKSLRSQRQQKI